MNTDPVRAFQSDAKEQHLAFLIEKYNTNNRQNWVLQAIANCVLGNAEGFQKNVYRHLIKRMLDPNRVSPDKQVESLLQLGGWKCGQFQYKKQSRRGKTKQGKTQKGRAWWTIRFPHFNLVGRGNRPRTVLHSDWKTTKEA